MLAHKRSQFLVAVEKGVANETERDDLTVAKMRRLAPLPQTALPIQGLIAIVYQNEPHRENIVPVAFRDLIGEAAPGTPPGEIGVFTVYDIVQSLVLTFLVNDDKIAHNNGIRGDGEMAAAADLKSAGVNPPCGFDSLSPHENQDLRDSLTLEGLGLLTTSTYPMKSLHKKPRFFQPRRAPRSRRKTREIFVYLRVLRGSLPVWFRRVRVRVYVFAIRHVTPQSLFGWRFPGYEPNGWDQSGWFLPATAS